MQESNTLDWWTGSVRPQSRSTEPLRTCKNIEWCLAASCSKPSWRGLRQRVQALTCLWPASSSVRFCVLLWLWESCPPPKRRLRISYGFLLFDYYSTHWDMSKPAARKHQQNTSASRSSGHCRVWSSGLKMQLQTTCIRASQHKKARRYGSRLDTAGGCDFGNQRL